jgi:hypothetical protein
MSKPVLGLLAGLALVSVLGEVRRRGEAGAGSRGGSPARQRGPRHPAPGAPEAESQDDPNRPLTERELQRLGIANVWVMDVEADDGRLPPRMAELSMLRRELTPAEGREIIAWARSSAPGWYWRD